LALKTLAQNVVRACEGAKCGLKYVMQSFGKLDKKSGAEAPLVLQQMNTFISRVAAGFRVCSLE